MRKLITALVALGLVLAACTTFKSTAGKTLASSALTVDAAMKGWATWVVKMNVPETQQSPVRDAYLKYQASMAVATNAYNTAVLTGDQTGWQQAQNILQNNQQALLNLIRSFQTR